LSIPKCAFYVSVEYTMHIYYILRLQNIHNMQYEAQGIWYVFLWKLILNRYLVTPKLKKGIRTDWRNRGKNDPGLRSIISQRVLYGGYISGKPGHIYRSLLFHSPSFTTLIAIIIRSSSRGEIQHLIWSQIAGITLVGTSSLAWR